ncbi:hypothetical protein IGI04_002285 [Brassica rapa subsp. trilocularis]|uniref:Leucine-rich repeat-containing N-terminal plant-type domain-containing protein n=1 Tax=Brassica rapa subsp. trilocularis TaxID=1813537 RepID=A0ABQ7NV75_BRACM|nr:hypothetical protein IGI04_002285 [Brassica rapa subsp. trilocularis]
MNLSNNGFQGNLPFSFGEMKKIEFLDLSHNNFSGTLPIKLLTSCYKLFTWKLSYNSFTGQIFSQPTKLTSMMVLIADNNQFTGIGDGLLNSTGLVYFDLSNNLLQGVIPSWFGGFHFMYFSASDNLINGTIPSSLFNIPFKLLDLSRNKFSGSLPSNFSGRDMGLLYLYDNEFSGLVPSTLLENAMLLDMRSVRASRGMFASIGVEAKLFVFLDLPLEFYLDYSGYLDFSVEFTSKRRYDSYTGESFDFIFGLDFSDIELSGEIPRELGDLQRMRALNLSYNSLSGSIPSQGNFFTLDETNYIGNPFLCGSPVNRSCDDNNTTGEKETNYRRKDGGVAIDMEMFYWSLGTSYTVILMTFIVLLNDREEKMTEPSCRVLLLRNNRLRGHIP